MTESRECLADAKKDSIVDIQSSSYEVNGAAEGDLGQTDDPEGDKLLRVKMIEAELTCAICLDRFDDPKVLPCLHTYCRKCVESLVTDESPERSSKIVPCLQCGEKHELPKGGADEFLASPAFGVLVKLLEVYKADLPGNKALTCQSGRDSNSAIVRCLDCDVYLCDSCLELHKMQASSRKHTTMTLKEIKESGGKCFQQPQYCPSHNKESKMFCCSCSKLMCGDCSNEHSSHENVLSASELKTELNKFLKSARGLGDEVKERKRMLDESMAKHKANVAAIHAKVDSTIDGIVELLRKRQSEIHGEIDAQAKEEDEAISALRHLASTTSFVDRLLQTASDADLVAAGHQTLEQCNKVESTIVDKRPLEVTEWSFDDIDAHSKKIADLKVQVKLPVKEFTTSRK